MIFLKGSHFSQDFSLIQNKNKYNIYMYSTWKSFIIVITILVYAVYLLLL